MKISPHGWIEPAKKKTFYRPNDFYPLSDGNYWIIFSDNGVATAENLPGRTYEFSLFDTAKKQYLHHNVLSFDWTGGVLVGDHNEGRIVMFDVPYKRQSQFDFEDGQLVYGWTEDFLFKVYDEEGRYRHAFYYPFKKQEMNEEAALAHYNNPGDNVKAAVLNDTLPATFPAFDTMLLDNKQRLWVSSVTETPEEYQWRVLDTEGRLLAQFRWPGNRSIEVVQGEYLYSIERNEKNGVQEISRYQIGLQ